jgi:hypothetical protein
MRNQLFEYTSAFLVQSPSENVYYTWKWIRTGQDHESVDQKLKTLWNMCNVYDWVEFRTVFEGEFLRIGAQYESIYDVFKKNILKQLTDVLDAASGDLHISGVILDSIHSIKNI